MRRSGDRVYFQPWWRDGKHNNCVMSLSRGNWSDLREQTIGANAREFARVALNDTLPGMMNRYGNHSVYDAVVPAPPPVVAAEDITEYWLHISDLGRRCKPLHSWLKARGVSPEHQHATPALVGIVDTYDVLPHLPATAIAEWRFLERAGPCAAFPLRGQDGRVYNLHLRPLGSFPKRVFLPGVPLRAPSGPLGYGAMGGVLEVGSVCLVEGAFDTLAMSLSTTAPVIGAPAAGLFPAFTELLRGKVRGEVVAFPQLDTENKFGQRVGQLAAARALVALQRYGIPARFGDWDAIMDGLPAQGIKDIGDVVKIIGTAGLTRRMRGLV